MTGEAELQRSIERLSEVVERLEDRLVRKDVYDADRARLVDALEALRRDIKDVDVKVEKIEDRRSNDRRLFIAAFLAPFVLILIQLYLASQPGGGAA